jgi:hypothetical protein
MAKDGLDATLQRDAVGFKRSETIS